MTSKPTNCDDCGACCMGQNMLPLSGHMVNDEIGELPEGLRDGLLHIHNGPLWGDDGCPCIWLNRVTGKCLHYEHRPSFCHEFEIGGEDCLRIRDAAFAGVVR